MSDQIKIVALQPVGGGYKITIPGLEQPLVVPEMVVHQYRLKQGIVLTPSQLAILQTESELVRADLTVARLLAMRDHTVGEIRTKLIKRRLPKEVIDKTIRKHRELGYLDDSRVGKVLAEQAYRRKPAGRSFLTAFLQRKMIERSLAEQIVTNLLEGESEIDTAVEALRRKWPVPEQIEVETVRNRVYSYLSRRGFGYQASRAAFSQHFGTAAKADED
jgi:SOS response regulatory protein OraA/RecX